MIGEVGVASHQGESPARTGLLIYPQQMLLLRHCTAALLAATTIQPRPLCARPPGAGRQAPPVSQAFEGTAEFTLFISGSRVGIERVRVARAGTTWIISSTALFGPPLNMTVNRFELKYTADWQPIELHVEATQTTTQGTRALGLATSFGMTTAINEITQNGVTSSKTDQISARTIVLPNNFYAAYEGLAARLAAAQPGAELPVYVAPQSEIKVTVKAIASEQLSDAVRSAPRHGATASPSTTRTACSTPASRSTRAGGWCGSRFPARGSRSSAPISRRWRRARSRSAIRTTPTSSSRPPASASRGR